MKWCEKNCGRPISGNKRWCLSCIHEMAQAGIEAREEEPMKETTHIITSYDSKDQEDLYRANGMLVASRQGDIVRFGSDIATAQSRLFLNKEMSAAWLRKLADLDLTCQRDGVGLHSRIDWGPDWPVISVIEERNAENLLTLPGNHTQLTRH